MADTREHVTLAVQLLGKGRTETMQGRTYRVVPAVFVRSQVLHNNLGRTYLPPDEITDAWAQALNGTHIVIDHPTRRGQPVSARDPEILNSRGVGHVFGANARSGSDGVREIAGEAWLEIARASAVNELGAILSALDEGRVPELSTAFPLRAIEAAPGVANGREYQSVLRPAMTWDHLALFADKIGACSVRDGCGLGVNHEGPCDTGEPMDEKQVGRLEQAINRLGEKLTTFFGGQKPDDPPKPAANEGDPPPEGDDDMTREHMIAQLAAAGPLDKDALNKLSDCQLQALAGANNAAEPTGDGWGKAREWQEKFTRLEAETEVARNELAREKTDLLDRLLFNIARLPYEESELKAMDIVQLRKVDALAFPERKFYGGLGGPRGGEPTFRGDWIKPRITANGSALDRKEAH